jgi:cytochrome c-type biogenesis protein CcmH
MNLLRAPGPNPWLYARWCARWCAPLCASLLACLLVAAQAEEAAPLAADPALEVRVNKLSEELRCLVCQNQTIADSHSGLANDLKQQIREQLKAGRNDQQVLDFMVERYGDFVLYRPPVKATTTLLWFGPFALLLVGAWALVRRLRRHRGDVAGQALDAQQQQRAAALLEPGGEAR